MTDTHNWRDIRAQTIRTPEDEARVEDYKRLMNLEGKLAELRESTGLSQRALAERLGVSQPNISRIEREDDLQISTIGKYVAALGGHIEIRAVIGDAAIVILNDETPISAG